MEELFSLFKQVLIAHIETKTTCPTFHDKSQEFYELLFDVFHQISEKRQDTEEDMPQMEETLIQQTYDNIEKAKLIIEWMVKEKNSIWMDNLLRWLADKLEFACGNARAFINEENEEITEKTSAVQKEVSFVKDVKPIKIWIKPY